jgi:hypothetical protein
MLTETLLKIPFSVTMVDIFRRGPLIGCRENAQEIICHGSFRYDFTESLSAYYMHFQCQNRPFKVFEEGITETILKVESDCAGAS